MAGAFSITYTCFMLVPIGLDLSLTSTGFACGEIRSAVAVKTKGPERLVQVTEAILDLATAIDGDKVCIIEGYAFASRNSQAHSIGELGGVVRVELWKRDIPYVEVPPTVRAKFATGKGNASKGEVLSAVSARTGITWVGKGADDICDAFVLEEMGLTYLKRQRYEWPSLNRSALEKVDWTPISKALDESK